MRISISTKFKADKFTFTEFYNKRIHFNRLEIMDAVDVIELIDRKPIHWVAIDLFNKTWGGIDVDTEAEQVAQVIKSSSCGMLLDTMFLIQNYNLDRLIVVLSGVTNNPVPVDIYIAYSGSSETFDTYMKELNLETCDYNMIHDYVKNS